MAAKAATAHFGGAPIASTSPSCILMILLCLCSRSTLSKINTATWNKNAIQKQAIKILTLRSASCRLKVYPPCVGCVNRNRELPFTSDMEVNVKKIISTSQVADHVERLTIERAGAGISPKPKGRPLEWGKVRMYEEIERLKETLDCTWEEAVAVYNREYGRRFTAAQVRQWGKRARRRARGHLVGAGRDAPFVDDDPGFEYGM